MCGTLKHKLTEGKTKQEKDFHLMAIIITICNFWFIKHVDKSIEPLPGIRGNGCDSSQHQRTSRTNSIQNEAMATHH